MRPILLSACSLVISIALSNTAHAQLFDRLKNTVRQTAEDRANDAAANGTNKAIDKGSTAAKNKKEKKPAAGANDSPAVTDSPDQVPVDPQKMKAYQNYDFVAGDKIILEDDFSTDQDGEFPAHWELKKGQAVTNLQQGKKALVLTEGNYAVVSPRITGKDYLGKEFTIEFDTYPVAGASALIVYFHVAATEYDSDGQLSFNGDEVQYNHDEDKHPIDLRGKMPSAISGDAYQNKWHHIALGYKNRQMKVYVDQYRVLTVPDCQIDPARMSLAGAAMEDAPQVITGIKIAQGGSQNMIGSILTDGRFITHGITFDVDKAVLKPESMGVINEICSFLKSNSGVRIEIDGHTDNTGAAPHNMTLSQQRAEAVKNQLVNMGIDASRLSTRGFGDTRPLSNNNTPEGRSNNRRVELVKQ